jgi:hypothetical protein
MLSRAGRGRGPAADTSISALFARIDTSFPAVQQAWSNRDEEALRPIVSDAYLARSRPVMEGLDRDLQVNRIEGYELRDVRLRAREGSDEGDVHAYLGFITRDWVEDLRTGQVVRGRPDELVSFVERWTFAPHPERGWVLDKVSPVSRWKGKVPAARLWKDLPPARYTRREDPDSSEEWDGTRWVESPSEAGS